MTLKEEFDSLRKAFTETRDEDVREGISARIAELVRDHPDEASEAFIASIDDAMERISADKVKECLAPVLDVIQLKHIATQYFHKTPAWLSQRLNGNMVGGRPMGLKPDEARQLEAAIQDIGGKLAGFRFPEYIVKHS